MKRKILAISGGIDSAVMLHMMKKDPALIVAHFNHGTRQNSDADENFVQQLAKTYHLPFVSKKEHLGPDCSEAHARNRRYEFLNTVAQEHQGEIYTAHHQDDLIETIAINLLRGTGWRGLVPLDDPKIHRPLLNLTKNDIYQYATKYDLTFRHDPTNTTDNYLRNRLRPSLANLAPPQKQQLINKHDQQKTIKNEIDQIIQSLLPTNHTYERSWFFDLDDNIALEILRAGLITANHTATRPQLTDFLTAIRTYRSNKKFNLSADHLVTINKSTFKLN